MMKHLFTFLVGAATLICGCVQAAGAEQNNGCQKVLVAYFSATGTTAAAAKKLAQVTGATLYAISPKKPYSAADLDWRNDKSRCYAEMHGLATRPELGGEPINTAEFDTVYIGFPIWWDAYPGIIAAFIEAHDLRGKYIIPFATSGSSSIAHCAELLKKHYPSLRWGTGKRLNGADITDIKKWIEQNTPKA